MNRSSRIALTAVAASAVIAGAAGVVAVGTLGPAVAQGPDLPPIASEPAAAPDPASLHQAVARLTQQTIGLRAELAAARRRLAAAPGPAASPGGPAVGSAARQATRPAPPVHTRTGASSASGQQETEAEDD
jgi:hypothetical protein